MESMRHHYTHYFQPTNFTCGHAALAMVLSHYNIIMPPEKLIHDLNAPRDSHGEICGGLNQYVGSWCLSHGLSVTFYTSDFELLDLTWAELSRENQIERIERIRKSLRVVTALGAEGTLLHLNAFLEFLQLGGELYITPYISSSLIDSLLMRAPILASVSYSTLYGIGRTRSTGLRESVLDDMLGTVCTHAVVVVGINSDGDYLIADPYRSAQPISVLKERFVAALAAAQFCCESAILFIEPKTGAADFSNTISSI